MFVVGFTRTYNIINAVGSYRENLTKYDGMARVLLLQQNRYPTKVNINYIIVTPNQRRSLTSPEGGGEYILHIIHTHFTYLIGI